ncbi:hypothetical protein [Actinomyces qiguomingii]|uniref:hypothetical protein n=1 Tax=Actinomyces qiguomingii TaxID=2057800 RepID=UPI000FFF58CE|nr:hypothetical protein [Actinomyces qiguomingii]
MSKPQTVVDAPHWAVSTIAYGTWGWQTGPAGYTYGDLGAWALDLYSLFGTWQHKGGGEDLYTWAFSRLGSDDDAAGFGRGDLLADVDAWLVKSNETGGSGTSFRDRLRKLCAIPSNDRVRLFYRARFGSSKANVDAAFKGIAYGLDVGSFKDVGFTLPLLRAAAGFKSVPTEAQRQALTSAFADRLARGL